MVTARCVGSGQHVLEVGFYRKSTQYPRADARRLPAGWSEHVVYTDRLEVIMNLAKRRGFVYPSCEIYGGLRAAWDYGPLGVELKHNIKRQWWQAMVTDRDDVVGLDSCVVLAPEVWQASGHVEHFVDPLTECQACRRRFRYDQLREQFTERLGRAPDPRLADVNCPSCGTRGAFSEPRMFSGLMKTHVGPEDDQASAAYLRPETAQGIFVNYANVQQSARKKPPFGIAQIGKNFRNEISPGNFLYRMREFEQLELEYFVKPGSDDEWHQYWIDARVQWYVDLGIAKDNVRLREQSEKERPSRFAKRGVNVEYRFDFIGAEWGELEGITNRTDHDLTAHAQASGADLSYYDQELGERWTPSAIEPSAGVDRAVLAFLLDAYTEDLAPNSKGGMDRRVVLRLDQRLAPIKIAVLPLSRNSELSPRARSVADSLRSQWSVEFDDAGAIGRRYRRQDEIGTPYCVTLDFDTPADGAATVRERDSMRQERVSLGKLEQYLAARLTAGGSAVR